MPIEYHEGIRLLKQVLLSTGLSVIPLYIRNADKGLQFVGSSIYCRHHNVELLFTARHVVEDVWPAKLWYPSSDEESRPLPCDGFQMTENRSDDFCVAHLDSSLSAWKPFVYDNIGQFLTYKEYQHLLVGYPWSFTKKSSRMVQKLKLQGYLTSPAPESEYARLNVDTSSGMALLFKKEKVYDENHKYINFPDPIGMSGGAVFQFNENIPQDISLVGMMTRWDTHRKSAIVAVKIDAIKCLFSLQKLV
jgi:hypothetical protein